jgi:hypothetical protein
VAELPSSPADDVLSFLRFLRIPFLLFSFFSVASPAVQSMEEVAEPRERCRLDRRVAGDGGESPLATSLLVSLKEVSPARLLAPSKTISVRQDRI